MVDPFKSPGFAFLRFHLNVGARLAAKILAPLIALFFAALYLFKIDFFVVLAQTFLYEPLPTNQHEKRDFIENLAQGILLK